MDMNEFWRSLGLTPGASPEEIKKQYRALARKHHPDKEGGSADKFCEIHEAYKMLTDPSYAFKNNRREQPVTVQTAITVEQAVFGVTIIHSVSKQSHAMQAEDAKEATVNHHTAEFTDQIQKGTLRFPHTIARSNIDFGDRKSAVIIIYNLIEHPYYKVTPDGRIVVNIELTAAEAMKGTKKEIQTLFGLRTLRIPPGTVPEDTFLIKKHGHLQPLIVRIAGIKYPRRAELKDNPNYSHLGINWEKEEEMDRQEQEEFDKIFDRITSTGK